MAATAPPVGAPGVPKPEPDASGTFSQARREAGLLRIQQAGVVVSDYATLMVEALADNAAPSPARSTPPSTCRSPSWSVRSPRPTRP
ncbi:hypothetical protein ACFY1B_40930 [Streptomyces mirabilis]|uniref:hypothetical protein n=1 Tax=Streptomyces mirabilis TaxID=68239 RepID=UPI00367CF29D